MHNLADTRTPGSLAELDPQLAPRSQGRDPRRNLRVGLVCSPQEYGGGEDFELLQWAGARRRILLDQLVWSDPTVDWSGYDALLPLRVWDYTMRPSSFRHWLSERDKDNSRIINSSSLLRWSMDKGYLIELQELGASMPLTQLRLAGSRSPGDWPQGETLVTKPRLGAGGRDVNIIPSGGWRAPRSDLLVQAYNPMIKQLGEVSIVMVAGEPLGQVRRLAAEDDFRVGENWDGSTRFEQLDPLAGSFARKVLSLLPEPPFYARVDLWDFSLPYLLCELELLEPDLFLRLIPGAPDAFMEHLSGLLLGDEPPRKLA